MHRRIDRGDIDRPEWRRRPVGNHEPRGGVHRQRRLHKTSSTELARRIGTKPRERKARRRWQSVMKSRDTEWALSRSIPFEHMPNLFPYGIYTIPEISMVGQTEE